MATLGMPNEIQIAPPGARAPLTKFWWCAGVPRRAQVREIISLGALRRFGGKRQTNLPVALLRTLRGIAQVFGPEADRS